MQDFLSDADVNLTFRYGFGHEPQIPDANSVVYSVLDHSGTPIPGQINIPVVTGPAEFQSNITVPAIYNTITGVKQFERRTIFLNYTYQGMTKGQTFSYRLIPFVNYSVTAQTVRAFLGIEEKELPDKDVDLFASYLFVNEAFSDPLTLDTALASGTRFEIAANDAIAMRAAIDIIPSLQNRVAQAEKNGVMGFDRIKITNFAELLAAAVNRYNAAVNLIGLIDVNALDYTLVTVTQDVDPITAGQT